MAQTGLLSLDRKKTKQTLKGLTPLPPAITWQPPIESENASAFAHSEIPGSSERQSVRGAKPRMREAAGDWEQNQKCKSRRRAGRRPTYTLRCGNSSSSLARYHTHRTSSFGFRVVRHPREMTLLCHKKETRNLNHPRTT